MPSLHLDHIALPVVDARKTHHFYSDILGLPLVDAHSGDDWGGKPWLMMIFGLGDNRQLALIAFRGGKKLGLGDLPADSRHFAFSVARSGELKSWQEKLRAAKIEFSEEDHGGQRSIYFSDPNGYILEITSPASDGGTEPSIEAARTVKAWIENVAIKAPVR